MMKRFFTYPLLMALALMLAAPAHAQDITTGLIGHWKLDETSGTVAVDSAGSNDGTMGGGLDAGNNSAPGRIGKAFQFDGNDNVSNTSFPQIAVPFSFSAWIRPDAAAVTSKASYIIRNSDIRNFYMTWDNDFLSPETLGFVTDLGSNRTVSIGTVTPGQWHHIVGVYDGITLQAYNNGVLVSSSSESNTPGDANDTLFIGENFDGLVDDVRIYNRALTEDDVFALYQARNPGAIRYNINHRVPEYFNETEWRAMGLPAGSNLDSGLIAYWKLEETSNPSLSEVSAHDMIWQGSPASVAGYNGTAISFDADTEFLYTSSNPDFEGLSEMTISAWVYPTGAPGSGWGRVVSKSDGGTGDDYALIHRSDNLAGFRVASTNIASNTALTPNTRWYHLTGVVHTNGQMILYVDGVYESDTTVSLPLTDSNLPLSIGRHFSSSTRNFTGYIDEVRFYNRALNSVEISSLHDLFETNNHPINLESGLIGHWKLEETSGTAVADETGTYNGTFTGEASVNSVSGQDGNALDFDGADDRLEVGNFDVNDTGISISAWIYAQTNPDDGRIVAKASTGASAAAHDWAFFFDNTGEIVFRLTTINGTDEFWTDYFLPLNQWRHLTVTYNEADDAVKLFVNGVLVSTAFHSFGGAVITGTGNDVAIGNMPGSAADNIRPWDGYLDEVRIYDRPLNASEARMLSLSRCANPDRKEGSVIYNTTANAMQFCNGEDWIAMGPPGDGGGGCTNPAGTSGQLVYQSTRRLMMYCEGSDWIAVGQKLAAPTEGLVGYWRLDETSGTAVEAAIGPDATMLGGLDATADAQPGFVGGALDFNGSGDYILANSDTSLDNLSTLTYCAWTYPQTYGEGGAGMIMAKGNTGSRKFEFQMDNTGGIVRHLQFVVWSSGTTLIAATPTDSFPSSYLNSWKHVCVTWNGGSARSDVTFYIDGQNVPTLTTAGADMTGTPNNDSSTPFSIGVLPASVANFDGLIDDVRIYNRALSPSEIADLYLATGGSF